MLSKLTMAGSTGIASSTSMSQSTTCLNRMRLFASTPLFGTTELEISTPPLSPPPNSPRVSYYYSKKSADHVCFMYRVLNTDGGGNRKVCMPEARGWPEIALTFEELDRHFERLEDEMISSNGISSNDGEVTFPSLADLKKFQLGSSVRFDHCDVKFSGTIVGRFVWRSVAPSSTFTLPDKTLSLVLLLQTPNNKLLLSSEVTDLQVQDSNGAGQGGEVYIQGITLLSIVATLIANVTYVAMIDPPGSTEEEESDITAATIFIFCNALAFFSSVLAVVVMTALIPIFGTGRHLRAIFLSGLTPLVIALLSFYIAFITCSYLDLGLTRDPLSITIIGVAMVICIRFWAVQLMSGHINKDLLVKSRMSSWDWFLKRTGERPTVLEHTQKRIRYICRFIARTPLWRAVPCVPSLIVTTRLDQQASFLFEEMKMTEIL